MDEKNSVVVRVFGQEYSISGSIPREQIMKLADMVDQRMKEVAESYKGSISSVAVLAAMNLAGELTEREDMVGQVKDMNDKLAEAQRYNDVLRVRIDELNKALENSKNAPEESQKLIRELEAKCRDVESSFFDIQMENIHLKNELEALRKQLR
jgi:cell division protein ZapA